MGHCKPEELNDIEDILEEIRQFDGLKERKKGVFYYKSKGFLHFHSKDGERWADARCGVNWGDAIDLPFTASPKQKKAFLKTIAYYYEETVSS